VHDGDDVWQVSEQTMPDVGTQTDPRDFVTDLHNSPFGKLHMQSFDDGQWAAGDVTSSYLRSSAQTRERKVMSDCLADVARYRDAAMFGQLQMKSFDDGQWATGSEVQPTFHHIQVIIALVLLHLCVCPTAVHTSTSAVSHTSDQRLNGSSYRILSLHRGRTIN